MPISGSIYTVPPSPYGRPIHTCRCLKPLRPPKAKHLVCRVHLRIESISQRKGDRNWKMNTSDPRLGPGWSNPLCHMISGLRVTSLSPNSCCSLTSHNTGHYHFSGP